MSSACCFILLLHLQNALTRGKVPTFMPLINTPNTQSFTIYAFRLLCLIILVTLFMFAWKQTVYMHINRIKYAPTNVSFFSLIFFLLMHIQQISMTYLLHLRMWTQFKTCPHTYAHAHLLTLSCLKEIWLYIHKLL